jgi:hypothetical protein
MTNFTLPTDVTTWTSTRTRQQEAADIESFLELLRLKNEDGSRKDHPIVTFLEENLITDISEICMLTREDLTLLTTVDTTGNSIPLGRLHQNQLAVFIQGYNFWSHIRDGPIQLSTITYDTYNNWRLRAYAPRGPLQVPYGYSDPLGRPPEFEIPSPNTIAVNSQIAAAAFPRAITYKIRSVVRRTDTERNSKLEPAHTGHDDLLAPYLDDFPDTLRSHFDDALREGRELPTVPGLTTFGETKKIPVFVTPTLDDNHTIGEKPTFNTSGSIIKDLDGRHDFNLKGTGPTTYHLGIDVLRDEHGFLRMTPLLYLAGDKMNLVLSEINTQRQGSEKDGIVVYPERFKVAYTCGLTRSWHWRG